MYVRSVQFSHSVVSNSLQSHELQHARPPCPSPTPWLPKLLSIESVMPSNLLILCPPPSPPAFNLSQHQGLFKWVSSSHRCPKYWSLSFNISPSNEHPGLISFRMDWLDLLATSIYLCISILLFFYFSPFLSTYLLVLFSLLYSPISTLL